MRGIVSLALALALPDVLPDGTPFPLRDLLILVVFVVIATTLLGQGLTLPFVIRAVGFRDDGSEERRTREALLKGSEAPPAPPRRDRAHDLHPALRPPALEPRRRSNHHRHQRRRPCLPCPARPADRDRAPDPRRAAQRRRRLRRDPPAPPGEPRSRGVAASSLIVFRDEIARRIRRSSDIPEWSSGMPEVWKIQYRHVTGRSAAEPRRAAPSIDLARQFTGLP